MFTVLKNAEKAYYLVKVRFCKKNKNKVVCFYLLKKFFTEVFTSDES